MASTEIRSALEILRIPTDETARAFRVRPRLCQRAWYGCGIAIGLVLVSSGCGFTPGLPLPNEAREPVDSEHFELLTRFVHISDAQILDEESPARLAFAADFTTSAWRPHEAYSTQLLDGFVRTVNKLHVARHTIDFVIHTGDVTDNVQQNELNWFITVMDGGMIDPLTGVDDRNPASKPEPLLDPHHSFEAQGLYRAGVHRDAPTIQWYNLFGNHDRFAVGVFPIVVDLFGNRFAPLPLQDRLGLFYPVVLDPLDDIAWGAITPANPGPPPKVGLPVPVPANSGRRYFSSVEFIDAHLESAGEPPGHGFDAEDPTRTWYTVSPLPGLRLIALNSASPPSPQPTLIYSEGAISLPQVIFLRQELEMAQAAGECVMVATHHSSASLAIAEGTALTPHSFRALLNGFACVKLHVAGHTHSHAVFDRGGYVEIVTGSTLDAPQEGRVIEIWRETEPRASARANTQPPGTDVQLRYWLFSHLDDIAPPDDSHADLFDDPLLPMRRVAAELAGVGNP